jgi:solute:Na+ symporter, SSS family
MDELLGAVASWPGMGLVVVVFGFAPGFCLIYLVITVAVVYLPTKLGGWSMIFDTADARFDATPSPEDGILLSANNQLQYATLALGSTLAAFLYPHVLTGWLPARSRNVIKRNMVALPAYSLLLGLLALLGFVAIAA